MLRSQSSPSQRRQRTAVKRPILQSAPAARFRLRAALTSSAPAPSQQTIHIQPAMHPPSALERVGRDVRVLILQWLGGRHKLTAVCRLSRSFHPLAALAFHYDSIAALLQGVATVHPDGRETGQLSCLRLHITQAEKPGRWTLFTCPRSLRSLPHMSALETLHITVQLRDIPEKTALLRCILRSVLSLQSLTTLAIACIPS